MEQKPLSKESFDKWVAFLENHKLLIQSAIHDYDRDGQISLGVLLVKLALEEPPKYKPYAKRLESRRLLCIIAMDNGIDLAAIKNKRGKMAMSRGLLDAWNKAYQEKYGGTYGTAGAKEAGRRDIKTRLAKQRPIDKEC